MELFCESCPKACENFLALCASNYYNGVLFHRNIKGFIVQTGDPTGSGKGGNSIWGKKFEDEFREQLKVFCIYINHNIQLWNNNIHQADVLLNNLCRTYSNLVRNRNKMINLTIY